jgi:hypothetical protein
MTRVRGLGRQCGHVNPETGEQCKAWALRATFEDRDEDDALPLCRVHHVLESEGEEGLSRAMSRMAKRGGVVRRGETEASPRLSGLDPELRFADVAPILHEALTARHEYTHEIDHNARLAAIGTLLSAWPKYLRTSPVECKQLLPDAIPEEILTPEMLDVERSYRELRASWDELDGLRWSKLKGLYMKPYPAWMIAPWENADRIQRSRPKSSADVLHLPNDDVAVKRPGKLPALIPVEEEDAVWARVPE